MQRILSIIGAISLAIIIGIGFFIAYATHEGDRLDASSKAYVEINVPIIVSNWSTQELIKRASPQMLNTIRDRPGQLNQLFHRLSLLGVMQSFGRVKGESNLSYTLSNGKHVTASYVATARFANGTANIRIKLIRHAGHWKILAFHVNSPLFF